MRNEIFLLSIILTLLNFTASCSKDDLQESNNLEDLNKAPNDFEIIIKSVTDNTATLNWQNAIDPENNPVTYTIYLGQTIILDKTSSLECKLTGLNELTNYTGKIIARDTKNNQTIKTFTFTTNKYFLKFIKSFDYADNQYSQNGSPYSMIKAKDGNYIIAGSSNFDANGAQFFVIKIDYRGNELWKKFYGYQIESSSNFKIAETSNGFILAALRHVLNIDNDGNIIWHKEILSYGNYVGIKSVKIDSFGNIFLVGSRENFDTNKGEAILTKLDNLGNLIWEKVFNTFNTSSICEFNDLIITSSNNLIIFGSIETSVDQVDFWVLNINTDGEKIWEKTYGDGRHDFSRQIISTRDGNYVFTGYSWGTYDVSYARLFKIDKEGNEIWSNKDFDNSEHASIYSVAETSDNGYILVGYIPTDDYNVGLFKYDSNGNPTWKKRYGEYGSELAGYSVISEDDGGFRIAATRYKYYFDNMDRPKLVVYKTDPEGNYE